MKSTPASRGKWLHNHPIVTFFIMIVAALVFGLSSYNIFFLFKANIALVIDYGVMALFDGALLQLVYLLLYGGVSLVALILFKSCEKIIIAKCVG